MKLTPEEKKFLIERIAANEAVPKNAKRAVSARIFFIIKVFFVLINLLLKLYGRVYFWLLTR